MRVCFITSSYPTSRGDYVGNTVRLTAEAVARRGHQVLVITPRHDTLLSPFAGVKVSECGGILAKALGGQNLLGIPTRKQVPILLMIVTSMLLAVRREIRSYRPHVIHAHWAVPSGLLAAVWCRPLRRALVITCLGSDLNTVPATSLGRFFIRRVLRLADYVIVLSTDLEERALTLGARRSRLRVVAAPLDEAGHERRTYDHNSSRPPVVVCVGRLDRNKGVEFIIRAMPMVIERFPECVLGVVGDGPDRQRLTQLSGSLLPETSVCFHGSVPHSLVKTYILNASVCVSASLAEGLPRFVVESMQLARPVVASNIGGSRDLISDGETGLLVRPGDPQAIADAIIRILSDPELSSMLGERAKAFVEHHFVAEQVASQIESIYLQAISNANTR